MQLNNKAYFNFSLVCLLISISQITEAAIWVKVSSSPQEVVYIDFSSIINQGISRIILVTTESKVRRKEGWMSSRAILEVDCNERRIRTLSEVLYEDNNLKGRIIQNVNYALPWDFVAPDTVGGDIAKASCVK